MEIEPKHNVFEIGCGSGIAAQRICPLLGRGTYLGIDKSPAAIKAAIARNAAYTKAGRSFFFEASFNVLDREPALFDRVFAVNVNLFWTDGYDIRTDVRRIVSKRSTFVQVYEPPSASQRRGIARAAAKNTEEIFENVATRMTTRGGAGLVAIIASVPKARTA
ncbi:MAG: class I SAM-dependent methyltransferase [Caulobacterales bacterium]|nr:class I SAM-dependent methyltransferase [Caulobacterales bacterium]